MQKIIRIKNLDCANCALELSEELAEIEGVEEAHADFINQRVKLVYSTDEALAKSIYLISHFEEVEIIDGSAPQKKDHHLKEIVSIAVGALFFIPALVLKILLDNEILQISEWIVFGLFMASFLAAGWSVMWNVITNFPRMFKGGFHLGVLLDENLLMTVAAIGAFAIFEPLEGAAVMLLYQIGELLQSIAVGSSRSAIRGLMSLQSDTAVRLTEGRQEEISPEELTVGDTILIRRGDKVPVDCKITEGETSLDTKSITGESYLKEVGVGSELLAGCVNEGGAVKAIVLRPSSESAVSKILNLVENSSEKKAKPEKFITKFARIYTPVVVLLAVLIATIPPIFWGYTLESFKTWLVPAIEFLVISCPCALIISVPLTYFSGVGTLARHGVLAKGAVGLDALARVKVAAFDKTGTLTEGKFTVANVTGGEHVLQVAAAAEKTSSHPLAQAFAEIDAPAAQSSEEIAGMGIAAVFEGKHVLVGSLRLMRERGIEVEEVQTEALVVYVAENGKYIGSVEIADRIRPEANSALVDLKGAGIKKVAVLTGDTKERAEAVLQDLPVDEVCAGLLPEEKPQRAEALKTQGPLLYVGDGINDTPVMAAADVAVAMGGLGSDAAIEASDFVLSTDNLSALPKAVRGAKKTRRIVAENIAFSLTVKIALMAVAVVAVAMKANDLIAFELPIWAAVIGDVGVMLLAVLNAMRMRAKIK